MLLCLTLALPIGLLLIPEALDRFVLFPFLYPDPVAQRALRLGALLIQQNQSQNKSCFIES